MKLDFVARTCPLCGGDDARVMVEATLDEGKLTASAFASRKLPEYMHSRMVECNSCGMLYANPVLRPETLADAYKDASFDSGAESRLAAVTYRSLLEPHLTALPSRTECARYWGGRRSVRRGVVGAGVYRRRRCRAFHGPHRRQPSLPFAVISSAVSLPQRNSRLGASISSPAFK